MGVPARWLRASISLLLLLLLLLIGAVSAGRLSAAQPSESPSSPDQRTAPATTAADPIAAVEKLIKKVEDSTELDASAKAALIDAYQKTLEHLREAQAWAAKAAQHEQDQQQSAQTIEQIRVELAQPPAEPHVEVAAEDSIAQFELKQAAANEALAAAQKLQTQLVADEIAQKERRTQAPKDLAAARQKLEEIDREISALPPADPASELAQATMRQAIARKSAIEQQIRALETEIATHDARLNLLAARRDRAGRRIAEAEKLAAAWRGAVEARLKDEQKKAAEIQSVKRAEAATVHPAIKGIATANAELAEQRSGPGSLLAQGAAASAELDKTRQQLRTVKDHFARLRAQIDAADRSGLQESIGRVLRKQRDSLPDPRQMAREIRARQRQIALAQDRLLTLDERWRNLADIDARVDEVLAGAETPTDPAQRGEIKAAARQLLDEQRELLKTLRDETESYVTKLGDIDAAQQEMLTAVDDFREVIDRRVLWIRSSTNPPLSAEDFANLGPALRWIFRPSAWAGVVRRLAADAAGNPITVSLAALALVLLLALQPWLRRELLVVASVVPGSFGERFSHTVGGLVLSALVAAVWPGLLLLIAWRLNVAEDAGAFEKAVALGLTRAALLLLGLEFLRQLCRSGGIGEKHFRWPHNGLRLVRRNLLWLELIALPIGFIIWAMEGQPVEEHRESLGRLAFIIGMLVMTVFLQRVLRPGGALAGEIIGRRRGGWLDRLQFIWFPLMLAMPLSMAGLAAAGYYYTALRLEQRLQLTILLVMALLLVSAMLVRWLYLARRRLAMAQARKRQEAAAAEGRAAPAVQMSEAAVAIEPEVDLWAISDQARKLLQSFIGFAMILGVWLIWSDVLPALAALDQVRLWSEPAQGALPATATTLKDLLLAAVILVVTFLAGKNIPGLLEIAILQRLPFRAGARYATTTIARYLIVIVGLIIAFNTIGIGWGKVQWIAAAITVGLGFGLQESIANFVSGLIILFEQPIRVGDTVTVGDVTGTVTRIRIRATTIVDWDRKELIIPNKTFVTGQVVNWSLSDPTLRLRIPVGVAYGSDTRLVRSLLLDVANANPHVLRQPEPLAIMVSFGESALNFELRVFIPNVDYLVAVRHELHDAIDQIFRKHNIEIAFPQRDIHIRSAVAPVLPGG